MSHQKQDNFGLAYARRIAEGLGAHPEWIDLAKENLERWSRLNADAPSLIRCYREWQGILEGSVEEVQAALLDATDRGQRIRQNSPFAGVFSAEEVLRMKGLSQEASTAWTGGSGGAFHHGADRLDKHETRERAR